MVRAGRIASSSRTTAMTRSAVISHRAIIVGGNRLHGAEISSPDIRAGMALLLAALCAKGESMIHNIHQIDRGYERIEQRLNAIGARIRRERDE